MANNQKKAELERTVSAGMQGSPQLRREEKRRFLGFFRERVLQAVTFEQLRSSVGKNAMEEAIRDDRADELVIHSKASSQTMPFIKQAQQKGLDFTLTSNPNFHGGTAAVVVAAGAIDVATVLAEEAIDV